jgi:hypothetical protein
MPEKSGAVVAGPAAWNAATTLSGEFPTVAQVDIAAILIDARRSVDMFGLSLADELVMAERIARDQLAELTAAPGDRRPSPRLDPQRRTRRADG